MRVAQFMRDVSSLSLAGVDELSLHVSGSNVRYIIVMIENNNIIII